MFHFAEDHGKPVPGWKLFNISDRDQRMLVDSVLMEEIPNDAAPDFLKVWKDFSQQANFMHGQQRVVDADTVLHHLEDGAPGPGIVCENSSKPNQTFAYRRKSHGVQAGLFSMSFRKRFNHVE